MSITMYGAPLPPPTGEPYVVPHIPVVTPDDVRARLAGLVPTAKRVRVAIRRDERGKLLLRIDSDGRLVSEVQVDLGDVVLSFDL